MGICAILMVDAVATGEVNYYFVLANPTFRMGDWPGLVLPWLMRMTYMFVVVSEWT